ncbi:MAG: DUF3256 family protein [Tannerella sp.]|jgi:hypothetical protein|nr:DUF3256 family protein [Tannerella sp.]
MKRLIISILVFFALGFARAQTVAEVFIEMPDEMIIQLEEAWRKDIIDLYKSGKPAVLTNTMQGRSELKILTDNYLLLETTERSTLELKLLPLVNNTHIICLISTCYAPAPDSKVEFYSTNWQKISGTELFTPATGAWFLKENADTASVQYGQAISLIYFDLIRYSLNANDNRLTAEFTYPQYLSEEERANLQPFLKEDRKIYEWRLSRFE